MTAVRSQYISIATDTHDEKAQKRTLAHYACKFSGDIERNKRKTRQTDVDPSDKKSLNKHGRRGLQQVSDDPHLRGDIHTATNCHNDRALHRHDDNQYKGLAEWLGYGLTK